MKLADLTPADRAAVRRQVAGTTQRTRPPLDRHQPRGQTPYRCHCGETFPSFGRAETHARAAHGCARLEADLGPGTGEQTSVTLKP